jgi:hypothetical protein
MESLIEEVQVPSFEGIETSTVTLAAARKCVDWMVVAILHLNQRAGFEVQLAAWIHDVAITSATQAAILWSHRLGEQARISLFHSWLDQSLALRPTSKLIESWDEMYSIRNRLVHSLLDSSEKVFLPSELDREFLLIFALAVTEKVRAESLESQARQSLRNVLVRLALSTEDLSRLFETSLNELETWESGLSPIRPEIRPVVNRVSSGVNKLLTMFRPERLPDVVRREAELFDGQSALAWILQGRIEDVVNRYERALAYQS